jgi:hypothetical protein
MSEKAPVPVDQSGYEDLHNLRDGHISPLDVAFSFNHALIPYDGMHGDLITNTGVFGSPQIIERTEVKPSGLENSLIALKGTAVHFVKDNTLKTLPDGREFGVVSTVSGMNHSVKNEDGSITNNLLDKDGNLNEGMEVAIHHITPGGDHESSTSTVNKLTGWRAERAAEIIAGRAARHIEAGIKERRTQLDAKK